VDSVAEEEAGAVEVAVITVVRKAQRPKSAVVVKVSMIRNLKRNLADREVATTEVVEVDEDAGEVDVVVIDVVQEQVAKVLATNLALMAMITMKETVTRDAMEEVEGGVTQEDVHEGSEDVPDVPPHKVPVTKEVTTAIMTATVISIQIINEENETIVVVIVAIGEIVVIEEIVVIVIAAIAVIEAIEEIAETGVIVETEVIEETGVIAVIAVIAEIAEIVEIGKVTVVDHEEVDMVATEKLRKVRMVMQAVRKKVVYAKSPTKWKRSRSRVEKQRHLQPFTCRHQVEGKLLRDDLFVYLNFRRLFCWLVEELVTTYSSL